MNQKTQSASDAPLAGLYPIRTVAQLTGINPVTLRAWERRYGLIEPTRTDKGHRLYSQADVDRINRILLLLDQGVALSQMDEVLEREHSAAPEAEHADLWSRYRDRIVAAIARFDEAGLDRIYNEMLALYPLALVIQRIIVPLLRFIGHRWERGEGLVAEEHFFHVFLRNKLGAQFHHLRRSGRGPRLLAACLPGEQHETGLLLFAHAAAERGFRLIVLGADQPLAELPDVARRCHADAIVLSGGIEPEFESLERQLGAMMRQLDIPVFVGGRSATRHEAEFSTCGLRPLGEDLEQGLGVIADQLDFRA